MKYLIVVALLMTGTPLWAAAQLRILLTNDDGFEAPGIRALHSALTEAGHDVYLIAPAAQQSGASASITSGGVEVTAHQGNIWAVQGRPADAVRFGLGNVMYNSPPDLIVSGANFGQNTGLDVNISGTVGAALTAYHLGFPAIAISVGIKPEERHKGFPSTQAAFAGAADFLVRIIGNLDIGAMPGVLNINYPAELPLDVRGIRWAKLSRHSILGQKYTRQDDGRYAPELVLPHPNARKNDAESLVDGFITLTYLDGNIEIPVNRIQKRIARGLLDYDYEPYRPARRELRVIAGDDEAADNPPKRKLREVPEPSEKASPAAKVASTTPVVVDSKPDIVYPETVTKAPEVIESTAVIVNVEPEKGNPEVVESAPVIVNTVSPQGDPEVIESTPDIVIEQTGQESASDPPDQVVEVASRPADVEETKEVVQPPEPKDIDYTQEPVKKKQPDSWLRRIFRPSSWRNP